MSEAKGITLTPKAVEIELLQGATLDWEQSLMSYGFKWKNPNATGDCGCGESFEVR